MSRPQPHDVSAERSIIGSMMHDNRVVSTAIDAGLELQDLYVSANRVILRAILAIYDRGDQIDIVVLTDELRKLGALEAVGGTPYLSELSQNIATAIDVKPWVRIVRKHAERRRVIQASLQAIKLAEDDEYDGDLAEACQNKLFEATITKRQSELVRVGQLLPTAFEHIESYRKGIIQGTKTGFADIDKYTGGFHNGELVILAGRPSMGKTALATCIGMNAAKRGQRVLFHSCEMNRQQMVERILCLEARVNIAAIRAGKFDDEQHQAMSFAASTLDEIPFYIDDTPAVSMAQIRSRYQRCEADLVIIDYLQLMSGLRGRSREEEIGGISRALKSFAGEISRPVVALSQLSRAVEQRKPPRPVLSDLRESGSIEQDADVVMFVYRPERYPQFYKKSNGNDRWGPIARRADIIIDKQRNGPVGTVCLEFTEWCAQFHDRETDK